MRTLSGEISRFRQESRPVHARHTHIGYDDGKLFAPANGVKPGLAALCDHYIKFPKRLRSMAASTLGSSSTHSTRARAVSVMMGLLYMSKHLLPQRELVQHACLFEIIVIGYVVVRQRDRNMYGTDRTGSYYS
jgi:hypothetical protein